MWGIGLGGFAKGLESGVGLGEKLRKARNDEDDRAKTTETETRHKQAMAAGMTDFQSAVSRGEADPNDTPASLRFAMPHVMRAALENNDPKRLEFFTKWKDSDEAKTGTRLFESAMRRISVGDVEGGWADVQKLGRHKGYGGEYEIGPLQKTGEGQFTTSIKTADGRTLNPTFADPSQFVATFGNPAAAVQDMQSARQQKLELDTYGRKKDIDLKHDKERQAQGIGREPTGEAALMDYLVHRKIVPDHKGAAEWVKQSKSNPTALRANLMKEGIKEGLTERDAALRAERAIRFGQTGEVPPGETDKPSTPGFFDRLFGTSRPQDASSNLTAPGNKITGIEVQDAPVGPPQGAPADARQARDGKWYAPDPKRPGKYLLVQ